MCFDNFIYNRNTNKNTNIMKISKFDNFFENQSSNTKGNTNGMGNVKSPQPNLKSNELPSKKKNENVQSFDDFYQLNEEGGVAATTAGNTAGMGNVSSPTVSSTPGDVSGSIAGSGDLPAYEPTVMKKDLPKKKKKSKKTSKKTSENTIYVTSWTDWLTESTHSFNGDKYDKKPIKVKDKILKVGDEFSYNGIGKWKDGEEKVAHYLGKIDDNQIIYDFGKKGTKYVIDKEDLIKKIK